MGLGNTAKKLQQVVDLADELYAKINDLKSDLTEIRDTIGETNSRVENLETELESQRALLEAIAESNGVAVDELAEDPEENTE
jgi:methyl-accepting chemotaxis protein